MTFSVYPASGAPRSLHRLLGCTKYLGCTQSPACAVRTSLYKSSVRVRCWCCLTWMNSEEARHGDKYRRLKIIQPHLDKWWAFSVNLFSILLTKSCCYYIAINMQEQSRVFCSTASLQIGNAEVAAPAARSRGSMPVTCRSTQSVESPWSKLFF